MRDRVLGGGARPSAEQIRDPVVAYFWRAGVAYFWRALKASAGLTRRELRDTCHIRNRTLGETLTTLQAAGRVRVEAGRVQLTLLSPDPDSVPAHP
ncbi:MAG TPA: hypothetical protein VM049_13200 [Gaiellaceae bacterium]|nr:hypothetical protein [Gaiellaceae bacterium]